MEGMHLLMKPTIQIRKDSLPLHPTNGHQMNNRRLKYPQGHMHKRTGSGRIIHS